MEIRLNKLISDAGLCSRREADKYIEEGRVTVNGNQPHFGQKVSANDLVMLDDIQIKVSKHLLEQAQTDPNRSPEPSRPVSTPKGSASKANARKESTDKEEKAKPKGAKGLRPGKYVKYNKYAAARHAAREGGKKPKDIKAKGFEDEVVKEALQPKFGKSLRRSAVAQRLVSSPKSAALRKTSRNNPINKAKRAALRNKPKG